MIEQKTYSHPLSLNLYGLNITSSTISNTNTAIIFEAEKSVLLMDSYYNEKNNSVAVCGSNFNKNQLLLLIKNCNIKNIILAFDKEYEKVGTSQYNKYIDKIRKIGLKYSNYANFYYILDKENLLQIKDSPIDKGADIFNYLLSKKMYIRSNYEL